VVKDKKNTIRVGTTEMPPHPNPSPRGDGLNPTPQKFLIIQKKVLVEYY
jgi:hypothetical protein